MRITFLLGAAALAACSPAEAPKTAAPEAASATDTAPAASPANESALDMTCGGPFKAGMTRADLVALFGGANVTDDVEAGPEGMEIPVSVLFAGDARRRAVVRWFDGPAATRPMSGVYADALDPAWKTPGGLKQGADLAAVEAANGRPFTISGFGWDYGGGVIDWKGGALDAGAPACIVQVKFQHGQDVPEDALTSVSGDAGFASDLPAMRAVGALASEIALGFPHPSPE